MNRTMLAQTLADPFFAEALFDQLANVVFFVKDTAGRYLVVNRTLMRRCGCIHKHEMIGRTAAEVFPAELGLGYTAQDQQVLASGQPIRDRLELHLYPNRAAGWCLTYKLPLHNAAQEIIGLAGISRDLQAPNRDDPVYGRIAAVVARIQQQFAEPLPLESLAAEAGMSVAQLERYFERMFGLTPKQLVIKTRLDAAARLLHGNASIAEIAHACGYADHSAFSRQFKAVVGLSPTDYRTLQLSNGQNQSPNDRAI